jgi:hypothetical protein
MSGLHLDILSFEFWLGWTSYKGRFSPAAKSKERQVRILKLLRAVFALLRTLTGLSTGQSHLK